MYLNKICDEFIYYFQSCYSPFFWSVFLPFFLSSSGDSGGLVLSIAPEGLLISSHHQWTRNPNTTLCVLGPRSRSLAVWLGKWDVITYLHPYSETVSREFYTCLVSVIIRVYFIIYVLIIIHIHRYIKSQQSGLCPLWCNQIIRLKLYINVNFWLPNFKLLSFKIWLLFTKIRQPAQHVQSSKWWQLTGWAKWSTCQCLSCTVGKVLAVVLYKYEMLYSISSFRHQQNSSFDNNNINNIVVPLMKPHVQNYLNLFFKFHKHNLCNQAHILTKLWIKLFIANWYIFEK